MSRASTEGKNANVCPDGHGWIAHVFGAQVPAFAAMHRVFVPEMRGRGHTADVAGPITYQLLTEDVVAFLEAVIGERAHVVGVSDGGIVGLLLALQRPDLIDRLVVVGSNFHPDGLMAADMWTQGSPDDDAWAGPRDHYGKVSPDGFDHFPVVFAKMQENVAPRPADADDRRDLRAGVTGARRGGRRRRDRPSPHSRLV